MHASQAPQVIVMHVAGWEVRCIIIWHGELGRSSLGQQQTSRKVFRPGVPSDSQALGGEEPSGSQLAARVFWAQGLYCVAARASLLDRHQGRPRNKCHFFHFLFLLFPDLVALLTCPPDLITAWERRARVWIWFPKEKMTYFSRWEIRTPKGRGTAWQGSRNDGFLCESFQLASRISRKQNEKSPRHVVHLARIYGTARNIWRRPGNRLVSCTSPHMHLDGCCVLTPRWLATYKIFVLSIPGGCSRACSFW